MGRPCPVSRARCWFVPPGELVSLSSPRLGNHQGRDSAVYGENSNDGRWIDGLSPTLITSSGCSGDWRRNFPPSAADETWRNRFVSSHICTKVCSVYPCIRVSKKTLGSGIQIVRLSRCNLLSKTLSGAELRSWYRNLCRVPGDQFTNNSSPPPLLDTAALMWWNFNGNNLGAEEEIGGISSPETILWPQQMCPVFIDKSLCGAGAGHMLHCSTCSSHTVSVTATRRREGTLLFWNKTYSS